MHYLPKLYSVYSMRAQRLLGLVQSSYITHIVSTRYCGSSERVPLAAK